MSRFGWSAGETELVEVAPPLPGLAREPEERYSPDQPRDDHGRFGEGGTSAPVTVQKWNKMTTAEKEQKVLTTLGLGETNNLEEAGFITPSGKYVKLVDADPGGTWVGHEGTAAEVFGVPLFDDNAPNHLPLLIDAGFPRIVPDFGSGFMDLSVELSQPLTDGQFSRLVKDSQDYHDSVSRFELALMVSPVGGLGPGVDTLYNFRSQDLTKAQIAAAFRAADNAARAVRGVEKRYSPDQPRDDHGRFGDFNIEIGPIGRPLTAKEHSALQSAAKEFPKARVFPSDLSFLISTNSRQPDVAGQYLGNRVYLNYKWPGGLEHLRATVIHEMAHGTMAEAQKLGSVNGVTADDMRSLYPLLRAFNSTAKDNPDEAWAEGVRTRIMEPNTVFPGPVEMTFRKMGL